jgi:rhodanese-related sulfurtransferase
MATFRDLLGAAKAQITEIDPQTAADHIASGARVLDVREPDEFDQGALTGVVHIPRGHLEAQVEARLADKTVPVVVYCAGGVRSAFAAKTLQELGYADVYSMAGGFSRWKDEGRPWTTPVTLSAEQRNRYSATCCCPRWAWRARPSCWAPRC